MLKTLFGKSPEYVGKIKDTLEARHFETTEVRYNYNVKITETFKMPYAEGSVTKQNRRRNLKFKLKFP